MYKIIHEIKKSIKIKQLKDLFRDDQVKNIETFHSNYLFTFAIEFILSGCLSIYLYKSSKYYNKNIENNVMSVPGGIKEKFELSSFLTKAVLFRCLTFIYFILFANRTSYDLISYVSFLFHIFPSFIFLMSLYLYIGFLIEKFYAISHKKIYVLTSLKYISYFSLLIIILLSLSVLVFKIYDESYFFIESLMCINFLIIGFLYAIYGRKITNFMNELNNIRTNNPIDMKSIRNSIHTKIICICLIISLSYIIFGGIKGLVAINFFGVWYPNFVDLNINNLDSKFIDYIDISKNNKCNIKKTLFIMDYNVPLDLIRKIIKENQEKYFIDDNLIYISISFEHINTIKNLFRFCILLSDNFL